MESISPRPADSARSSPAPSTGKVEAALKENSCGIEQRIGSITTDTEIAVTLPRKARMKDQVLFHALFEENKNQIINEKCEGFLAFLEVGYISLLFLFTSSSTNISAYTVLQT